MTRYLATGTPEEIAARAPMPSAEVIARLRALLGFDYEAETETRQRAERLSGERQAERERDRAAVRGRLARRRDPADIAAEVLSQKIDEMRAANSPRTRVTDPVVAEARHIQQQLDISWSDAFAQARAIAEYRRIEPLMYPGLDDEAVTS